MDLWGSEKKPPNYVIAMYRPKPGKNEVFKELVARHLHTLREEGLLTHRPAVLMRSEKDGTYLEILEWLNEQCEAQAQNNARVQEVRTAIERIAESKTFSDLGDSDQVFPHFYAVDASV